MKLRVRVNAFSVLRNELECTILESDSPELITGRTIMVDPFCSHIANEDEAKEFVGKEFVFEAYPYTVIARSMTGVNFHRERENIDPAKTEL